MALGALWMLIANLGVCAVSAALVRRHPSGSRSLDLVQFLLIRMLFISAAVGLAGLLGLLSAVPLGLAGLLALAAVLLTRAVPFGPLRLPALPAVPAAALAFAGLLMAAQVWFFVPVIGDVLSYHLPKIGEWIQHRGFTSEWGTDPRSTFPSGFELIETWWVVFLHHDVLLEMAGAECWFLGVASAWTLARQVGLAASSAALSAAGAALTPGLFLQATSGLNDGAVASLLAATTALILGRVPWGFLLIPVGLGLGIKPTYGFALPGLALLLWLDRREPRGMPAAVRTGAVLGSLALLTGASWYLRNLVQFGDPLHPMGRLGAFINEGHIAQQVGPRWTTLFENLRRLFDNRIYDREPYHPMLDLITGWGPFGLCGAVGLLWAVRERPALRRLGWAALASTLVTLSLVASDAWSLRFILFLAPLFCVGLAWAAEELPLLRPLAAACLLVQAAGVIMPASLPPGSLRELAGLSWRERSLGPYGAAALPPDQVGCMVGPGIRPYSLYGPAFERRVRYLRQETGAELAAELDRLGLNGFLGNPGGRPVKELLALGGWKRDVGSLYLRTPPR
jgi:hypothetical protein